MSIRPFALPSAALVSLGTVKFDNADVYKKSVKDSNLVQIGQKISGSTFVLFPATLYRQQSALFE
jgi:hypothetical protein